MTTRARWHQNSPASWILKEPIKNGGTVLATVVCRRSPDGVKYTSDWKWSAGEISGERESLYSAQRAARRALREGRDD